MSIRSALAGFAVGFFVATNAFAAPIPSTPLIGSGFDGTLYDVNIATGAATNPRATSTASLAGITFGPGGLLYGLTTYGGTPGNALVSLNPVTGATTTIGNTGLNQILEGDLAFSPSGVLYGLQNFVGMRDLFTISTTTGVGTNVGSVSILDDLSAMTFDANGTLYVIDSTAQRLLTVNPATAAILTTTPLSVDLGVLAGMAIDPATGTFYVADGTVSGVPGTNSLYTLAPATGTLTPVGATGLPDGLAGLAFAVPEPGSLGLLVLAGLAVQRRKL